MELTMVCQLDDVLRNLKALFAVGDPFAAEKATDTWQKYEEILWKETVSEINFSSLTSLPEDQLGTPNSRNMKKWSTSNQCGQQDNPSCKITLDVFFFYGDQYFVWLNSTVKF